MRILIIDDSEFIRNNLVRFINNTKLELEIEEAYDVESGKLHLLEFDPIIAIIDIRMPGGSGFDLVKYARHLSNTMIIVVLTNFANDQYRQRSMDLGANYFFDKSIEFAKLVELVKTTHAELNAD